MISRFTKAPRGGTPSGDDGDRTREVRNDLLDWCFGEGREHYRLFVYFCEAPSAVFPYNLVPDVS